MPERPILPYQKVALSWLDMDLVALGWTELNLPVIKMAESVITTEDKLKSSF
jgi:hypothetical protein